MNPGGSVKDRAALFLVHDAEKRGSLAPGGTVVEGTAGNTGVGLAHVCRSKAYKCVIFMPETQSKEKIDLLRMLGADVRPVKAVPFSDPENYNHQAKRYAESLPNAIWTDQFDNVCSFTLSSFLHVNMYATRSRDWEFCRSRTDKPTLKPRGLRSGSKLKADWMHLYVQLELVGRWLESPPTSRNNLKGASNATLQILQAPFSTR